MFSFLKRTDKKETIWMVLPKPISSAKMAFWPAHHL
jgi:hypothetical protein